MLHCYQIHKLVVFAFILITFNHAAAQMFDGVPGCRTTKLELVFVVDGSSSVSARGFYLAKQWIRNMTLNFDISPYTTRVAVVQYSNRFSTMLTFCDNGTSWREAAYEVICRRTTEPRTEFQLDSYEDSEGVLSGIANIQFMSGNTQTGRALRYVIDEVFVRSRPGSSKVVILLSDGQSQDEANEAAAAFRAEGIATFAVGVGDVARSGRVNELRQISHSAGSSDNVFLVDDFRSIGQIQESLIDAVCEQTVRECPTAKHDLAFVIDASSTIGYEDFAKIKAWMKKIVEAFDIGPDQTRVAVIQYSTSIQEEFNFGHLLNKREVLAAIDQMEYVMGDTHTGEALLYMLDSIYTEENGERPAIPNVAIVVTDGKAQDRQMVEASSLKVHEAGITVYSVGVGDYSLEEVKIIASDPDDHYVIEALDFDLIELKRVGLIQNICEESEQTCPTASAEIVFLVDGSNSIGYDNFQKLKLWMKNIVDAFQIGPYYTRIAVVQFTDVPYLEFGLTEHLTTQTTLMAIQNIRYKMGGTNIGRAIEFTMNNVFSESREGVPQILVALTDGHSQDDIRAAVKSASQAGVHSLVFGVGDVAPSQLRQMASQEDNVFRASGFDEVQRMRSKLVTLICVQAEPECASQEVDLHFLVDSSESIGVSNLNKVKTWMKNIVNSFDVGEYTTRVALSQYSSLVRNAFWLNQYGTKREIYHAIDQLELLGGPTYTGQALRRMRTEGFSVGHGGRRGAPKVLIVLTDGRSTDNIELAAKELHSDGVYVFSVGAGNTWTSALRVIGSAPEVTHVQEAASFDAINKFRRELVGEICRETTPECAETEMDLIFLVDGSTSIGSTNFEIAKDWMVSFVRQFEIGEYNTRIGVTQYSSRVRSEVDIGAYDSKGELIDAIRRIEYATGRTHTGSALDYIRNIGFSAQHGARRGVPKVLIVLTDGDAQDEVNEAARRLLRHGVEVYTIGVGRVNMRQLTAAMSHPDEFNGFHVRNYNAIKTIQSRLLRRVCENVEPDCAKTATDLMFLVDGSTSVGVENWKAVKSFMKNMTQKFRIAPNAVRVGVIQYSTWPRADIVLGEHENKADLHNAISNLQWQLGDTYTAKALRYVPTSYAQAKTRENLSTTKLLIVVTDGQPQDRNRVNEAVATLHGQGWRVFAIGIGQVSLRELGLLASNPNSDHVFYADNYNSTRKFQGRLSRLICGDPSNAEPKERSTPQPSPTRNTPRPRVELVDIRNILRNVVAPAALRQTTTTTALTTTPSYTAVYSDVGNSSSSSSCPPLRRNGKLSTGVDFLQVLGIRKPSAFAVLTTPISLGRPRRGTQQTFRSHRIDAGRIPALPLQNILPGGIPSKFTLVTTFRMHGRTIKENWTLMNVFGSNEDVLLSVAFNGRQRSMVVTRTGRTTKSTLRGPLIAKLFDRQFHKLELIFDPHAVTVMVDCQQVPAQIEFIQRETDFTGSNIFFVTSPSRGVTVDVQDLALKCHAEDAEECCEIPDLKCTSYPRLLSDSVATCGCLPTMKDPKVLEAEEAEISEIATRIANQIVEEKMGRLLTLLDLNPSDLLDPNNVAGGPIQVVSRRSSGKRPLYN